MKPAQYDMDKEEDVERWFRDMEGYLRVSNGGKGFILDGTDIKGRKLAMEGFKALKMKLVTGEKESANNAHWSSKIGFHDVEEFYPE